MPNGGALMNGHGMQVPAATIVVPTKNRKEDIRRALLSIRRQTARLHVIVMDDGSTDGTLEMLAVDFPEVEVHSSEVSRGPTAQRNRGTAMAPTPIVVSIDDDCEFVHSDTLSRALEGFNDPRVGLVSIPYIDVYIKPDVQGNSPAPNEPYAMSSFRGCSYAVRRDVFGEIGGYRESLFMDSEEEDLAIRLLDHGYVVLAGDAPPVHHYASPRRETVFRETIAARNLVLFTWFNVPGVFLLPHLLVTTTKSLLFGWRTNRFKEKASGLLRGYRDMVTYWNARKPVGTPAYRLFRRLRKRGPMPVRAVALPPSMQARPRRRELGTA